MADSPAIFAELANPKANPTARNPVVTSARQNLQDAYVRRLIQIALGNGVSPAVATARAQRAGRLPSQATDSPSGTMSGNRV